MNEQLKKWREAGFALVIRARVTLPFQRCVLIDHDQLGVTVRDGETIYCVPFSAITTIEET